ncbi:Uncharacterised protein [Mycobacteroides abscessus subsp. abscessus]|nr:Uncharacterised protein [Mycobacteroides abscessus subsp. abscessus]
MLLLLVNSRKRFCQSDPSFVMANPKRKSLLKLMKVQGKMLTLLVWVNCHLLLVVAPLPVMPHKSQMELLLF